MMTRIVDFPLKNKRFVPQFFEDVEILFAAYLLVVTKEVQGTLVIYIYD